MDLSQRHLVGSASLQHENERSSLGAAPLCGRDLARGRAGDDCGFAGGAGVSIGGGLAGRAPVGGAAVVGIRLEGQSNSRVGKLVLGGVALGVAGCVLAISLFRGGVIATRAFYAPFSQADLPFTPDDDYSAIVRALGQPQCERWRSGPREQDAEQYQLHAYPQRRLYVILMGSDRDHARY